MPSLATDTDEAHRVIYGMLMESWGTVTDTDFITKALVDAGFETPRVLTTPSWIRPVAAQR